MMSRLKRMKEEQAALDRYMNEQMSKLREQMQQELLQHQQALAEARKQQEAALQAEQDKQEQIMMQRQAEQEATLQEEREQHEHNLCLLIEQASAAQAEAVRATNPAPQPANAHDAPRPKPGADHADAHDVKAKLSGKDGSPDTRPPVSPACFAGPRPVPGRCCSTCHTNPASCPASPACSGRSRCSTGATRCPDPARCADRKPSTGDWCWTLQLLHPSKRMGGFVPNHAGAGLHARDPPSVGCRSLVL